MAAAVVEQGADVAVAVHFATNGLSVQQLQLGVAVALPVGFLLFQGFQLFMVHRHEQAARAVIALDLIPLDAFADDIAAFEHHAAEHFCRIRAVVLFNDVDIAAIGVDQLTAVAAAGAEADARPFQHHHVVAHFGQMQGRREAGVAAADDADVTVDGSLQRRERFILVGAGGIVASGMFSHDQDSRAIQMVFSSVNFSSACSDLSRPLPLCL